MKSQAERVAVFDLGSNSIKFLVAELSGNEISILKDKSAITRIGEGIQKTRILSEVAIARSLEAVAKFKSEAESFQIAKWKAVATSAVRDAENGQEFQKRFCEQTKIDLRILSGEEEAELIYRGVTSDLQFQNRPLLVIDSGGGSSEFIRGTSGRIEKRISLPLGCVRMTERFLKGDPYTYESFQQLVGFYREQLEPLQDSFSAKDRMVIGTGGSISTTAAMIHRAVSFEKDSIHGMELNLEQLDAQLKTLLEMNNEQRVQNYSLQPQRADVVTAGLAFFVTALPILEAKSIRLSLRGLRFGVLVSEKF